MHQIIHIYYLYSTSMQFNIFSAGHDHNHSHDDEHEHTNATKILQATTLL